MLADVRMPLANDKLLVAAQYAYDHRLSKPYTNKTNPWDWRYPEPAKGEDVFAPPPVGTNPIWRPNHGLAHSARGAMYAPTVIEYYKSVTANPAYNFSDADIEKIQIALMFRVSGRENESGYKEDKVSYAEYQKAHAQNFRAYCQANPGVFKDDAEIEKYAQILQTYANPAETSPLAIIFKTCHNLDLIRVRDSDELINDLAIPTQLLGDANVKQLMLYADSCIRATGSRILCDNPIIGRGPIGYEDGVFRVASANPAQCLQIIANIPKPPKPIIAIIPAKEMTAVKDALLNYPAADIQKTAIALYEIMSPSEILSQVKELFQNNLLSVDQKQQVLSKTSILLKSILKQEIPLFQCKEWVDYLTATNAVGVGLTNNHLVQNYNSLLINLKKSGISSQEIDEFEASIKQSAQQASASTKKSLAKQAEAAQRTDTVIDAGTIITQDLFNDPHTPDVAETIKQFADALKNKNIEYMLKINLGDLASPYRADIVSVRNISDFSTKITESVVSDIFNAKSKGHQEETYLYYCRVLQQCMINRDYNSVYAIYKALSLPEITRMKHLYSSLPKQDKKNLTDCSTFLNSKNPNGYYFINRKEIDIPIIPILISTLNNASKKLAAPDKDGVMRVDMKAMSVAGRVYDNFQQHRERLASMAIVPSQIELSRIDSVKVTSNAKKGQISKRVQPDVPFDLDVIDNAPDLIDAINGLYAVLNDHLLVPINLELISKGSSSGQHSFSYLLNTLEACKIELEAAALTGAQHKYLYQRIAILSQSIKEYGVNNQTADAAALLRIDSIQQFTIVNGVTPKITELREGQKKIAQFKQGKPSLNEIQIPVQMGPLYKVNYTREYEELIKGMLAGKSFTVAIVDKQAIISMGSNEYNLQEIMKYANLNQLVLSDADKAAYMKLLNDNATSLKFPPGFPPNNTPAMNVADFQKLNAMFDDPKFTELKGLTMPERLALNIYTTGFYNTVNPFMRGIDADNKFLDTHFVKELICHTGIAIHALNKIDDERPMVSFRAETSDHKTMPPYMKNRIDAAKTGDVTFEMGFISTAQDEPKLNFGDPDEPGGVGIIFKDLKGKNVRNLSAYENEREFLMPPTQIQWTSYTHAKGGHILEGRPVITPLNLAKKAISLDEYSPTSKQAKDEKAYADMFAKVMNPPELLHALLLLPNGLKDSKGNLIDISALTHEIQAILMDSKSVADIAANPLAYVPQLVNAGVVEKFGILKTLLKMVEVQHDLNQRKQAEADFSIALKGAASVDDLIKVINKFSSNSFINMGTAGDVVKMTKQMDEIASSPKVAKEIFDNHTLPFDQCDEILSNYKIKDIYFDLVARQYETQLHNAVEAVQNASSLNDLVDVVRKNISEGMFEMDPVVAAKMIDTMRHYANNPDIVSAIARQGDKSLFLKSSEITNDFNIRQLFINHARKQFVAKMTSPAELVQFLEGVSKTQKLQDSHGDIDVAKMLSNMKAILEDPNMCEFLINRPEQVNLVFHGTGVTTAFGIQEKFVEVAIKSYLENGIKNVKNATDLVKFLEGIQKSTKLEDQSGKMNVATVVQHMKTILQDKNILEHIVNRPDQVNMVFHGTGITNLHGIRDKFIEMAKKHYIAQYAPRPLITRQKAMTFALDKSKGAGAAVSASASASASAKNANGVAAVVAKNANQISAIPDIKEGLEGKKRKL